MNELIDFIRNVIESWQHTGLYYVGLWLFFAIMIKFFPCNEKQDYWKTPNIITDLIYWFVIPIFTRILKITLFVFVAHYAFGLTNMVDQEIYFAHGYGPISELPIFLQALLLLIITDFIFYWTHRLYHSKVLWKFHAVHHSSKEVDWPSAYRFHPINTWTTFTIVELGMVFIGFAPAAFVILVPFNVFYSAFVHANLNWTLGPFKTVLASPVFHRWHHTMPVEGGEKNFAPTFPILDIMFGTYYMPEDKLPEKYGVMDEAFPTNSFVGQLIYPFRK